MDACPQPMGDWLPDQDGRFLGSDVRRWDASKLVNVAGGKWTVGREFSFYYYSGSHTLYWHVIPSGSYGESEDYFDLQWLPAGTFTRMRVRVLDNMLQDTFTIRLRKNNQDTTLAVTVPAGTMGLYNSSNQVSVADGDKVNMKGVMGSGVQAGDSIWIAQLLEFKTS